MIEQEDCIAFANELKDWLDNLATTEAQAASSQLSAKTTSVSEKLNLRKTLATRVFSRRVMAVIYPEFASYLLGNIPDTIEMELRSEPELPFTDAAMLLLQELCGTIKSFDKCDLIKGLVEKILESATSPLPLPNMPFNDDDPYMKVTD